MLDLVLVVVAGTAAYLARFEGRIPPTFFRQLAVVIPVLALARVAANRLFGVYRMVWRYVGLVEALRFAQACAAVSALLLFAGSSSASSTATSSSRSRSSSWRARCRSSAWSAYGSCRASAASARARDSGMATLIIGAGQGGLAVVKEAVRHPELGIRPIGFLDDDPARPARRSATLRVLGTVRDADRVVRQTGAERVVISSPVIPSKVVAQVMDACTPLGVEVGSSRAPTTSSTRGARGDDGAGLMREVRIEDLLARDPMPPSLSLDDLRRHYGGKRVLVTGAGGSIGSELCRQLAAMGPGPAVPVPSATRPTCSRSSASWPGSRTTAGHHAGLARHHGRQGPRARPSRTCSPRSSSTPPPTSTCR
jgi:FlaA1/EpsC-like NDP-sugar epimerase